MDTVIAMHTFPHSFKRTRIFSAVAVVLVAACHAAAMTPGDFAARLARNEHMLLIDVRSGIAYQQGHIPGAINIPLSLLPHKQIPSAHLVVVYGDGLGIVDDNSALSAARLKRGVIADVIEGGYAAWLTETHISTSEPGLNAERLPGITYQQLVASSRADMVFVDLRSPAGPQPVAESKSKSGRTMAAARAPDVLGEFGGKMGIPVMRPARTLNMAAATAEPMKEAAIGASSIASQLGSGNKAGKLLVLVADTDAAANEAARHLRASGYYRFTILIGGTESIRHEGREGMSRMDGSAPPVPSQP